MRTRHTASFAFASVWFASVIGVAGVGARAQSVDEQDLRQTDMAVVRSVSRSVLGAQKAERNRAEKAGVMALGRDLKRLQELLRDRPIVHVGNARLDLAGGTRARTGGDAGASTGNGSEAMRAARGRLPGPRVDRAASFERAHADMLADKEMLRRNLSLLRASRQREVAEALLKRLDAMEAMLVDATTEMTAEAPQGGPMVEALSREMRPLDSTRPREGPHPLEPTMTTRIRHRREVPRVP